MLTFGGFLLLSGRLGDLLGTAAISPRYRYHVGFGACGWDSQGC